MVDAVLGLIKQRDRMAQGGQTAPPVPVARAA
jgi:hypothetical protein